MVDLNTVRFLWPEIILVVMAALIYFLSTIRQHRYVWTCVALLSYLVAGFALVAQLRNVPVEGTGMRLWQALQETGYVANSGPLVIDSLAGTFRGLAIVVGFLFTLTGASSPRRELSGEFLGSLMFVTVGMMLVASASELVFLFVGLELISIPTYVLLFLGRRDQAGAEATVKYFFLGILSSALLLYGFSFYYGLAGSTSLHQIAAASAGEGSQVVLASIALVLILAGLGFKIAAFPFHFYAPDVYEGAGNANAGLLAVAPKVAGIVAMVRLLALVGPATAGFAWHVVIVLAMVTMTVGNVCALWQQNVRRLLAYSSIAHAGYMLIGLATALAARDTGGMAATLLYVFVYALATLGTFAALAHLGRSGKEVSGVGELAGLIRTRPEMAGAISLFMFSLAGIPPLAGFWGKFGLFSSAISLATREPSESALPVWFLVLAIVAALNAAIAAAYYLRVVAVMFFRSSATELPAKGGPGPRLATAVCVVAVLFVGLVPGRWFAYSRTAGYGVETASPAASPPDEAVSKSATAQSNREKP